MSYYFPGLNEARAKVEKMDLEQLLRHIDSLYGRDNLKYGDGVEEVRAEALRQTERDFTDTTSQEYKDRERRKYSQYYRDLYGPKEGR